MFVEKKLHKQLRNMSAPKEISELVAKFRDNISEYKSQHYNETEVRREFIDPFFEALGWDVFNKAGYSEAYKDVKHEAAVKIKGETKNPDYAFRVGGKEKFFVEAKKPAVNISGDKNPIFQVRSYGWSAHLSLCVLTDFEEFAVYDCRVKPFINDAPSSSRIMYFNFNDYESKWDEIASVFSKEAVLKGSFDKYANDNKKKKGTTEVDDDFLALMESWRESLAMNIALRNKSSQQFTGANAAKNLNEAVQKTIDRIVFLRICEDRGIEEPDQLRNASKKNNVYGSLCDIFNLADAKYNSGLFHFQKESGREQDESWMLSLSIDDKVLKDIIKNLYYPAPYAFSVMPADILGHVYEKFLGKVIRLTAGNMAKVEEKPEVRKAGGVYYTPTYIVDYIVKNTVGELLKDKTPAEAESIRILDPACGSGSFLIGAYQYLLDWYLNAYSSDSKKHATGKNPKIIAGEGGEFRLTTAEKKKILLNNIYGCLLYTSPSPRDRQKSRMPSSA